MPSISDVDQKFVQHLQNLTDLANKEGEGLAGYGQRLWFNPPSPAGMSLNNPSAPNAKFDREALNSKYSQVVQGQGNSGDKIALARQIDYIADYERAWRASRCSYIRCRMMQAARYKAHGDSAGVFNGFVLRTVQDFVRNAKESPK